MTKAEQHEPEHPFRRSFLFERLSPADRAWLEGQLVRLASIHYAPGEKIIHEDMPAMGFYLIGRGHVKVIQPGENTRKKQMIKIVGPGELLGEESLLGDGLFTYYAEALTPVEARFLSQAHFELLIERCPQLSRNLSRKLALEVKAMEKRLLEASFYSCKERVARLLLAVAHAFGQRNRQGQLEVDWKREDMADLAGVSVETAIRTLSEFERAGWVRVRYHTITLLDEPRLEALFQPFGVEVLENVL